jgi:hypothetical protein
MNANVGVTVATFALSKGVLTFGVVTLYPHSSVQSRCAGVPPIFVKFALNRIVLYTDASTVKSEVDPVAPPNALLFPGRSISGIRFHIPVIESKYSI